MPDDSKIDYKSTLNLPDTPFPMRGDLARREPGWVKDWQERKVYAAIRAASKGRKRFLLHDGPPYAKRRSTSAPRSTRSSRTSWSRAVQLAGFDAPYVPGWDCHGMPIEVQIEKTYGKHLPTAETQRLCRAYASEQIAQQMAGFQRLGRARRLGASLHDDGLSQRGRRNSRARPAAGEGLPLSRPEAGELVLRLSERARRGRGRIRGRRDTAVDVAFPADRPRRARQARARRSDSSGAPAGSIAAVIWTTTPWTLPANQALNVNPDFRYALVRTARGDCLLAADLVDALPQALRPRGHGVGHRAGRGARRARRSSTRSTIASRRCTSATS